MAKTEDKAKENKASAEVAESESKKVAAKSSKSKDKPETSKARKETASKDASAEKSEKSTNKESAKKKSSSSKPREMTNKTTAKLEDSKNEESKQAVSDTYAIVRKGNHQYLLEKGALLEIPRINVPEGREYIFEEVLLASINNELKVGTPTVKGAYVKVFVIKQVKGKKQRGFKYKAKSRYRRTWGYRNPTTRIRVIEIKA